MADINAALDASKEAMEQLIIAGERTKSAWTSPCAPRERRLICCRSVERQRGPFIARPGRSELESHFVTRLRPPVPRRPSMRSPSPSTSSSAAFVSP